MASQSGRYRHDSPSVSSLRPCRNFLPAWMILMAMHNPTPAPESKIALGLRANWQQFALLVVINAFVGGMVGIERTVVPLIGAEDFGIASTTLILSFIVSFGVVKAFANLVSGQLADAWGRKH